jgi:ABC-type transporter Mla subunit MlaD
MSRRWIPIAIVGAILAVAVVAVASGSGGDGTEGYKVRAIFRNASYLIPGEDVKIAGAKVGVVESLDVTKDNKAAVTMRIDDPAFQDFRRDAECEIRLQSLIGEKLVECKPTQPRSEGEPPPPPLPAIPDGLPGAGEHYLPVTHTITPVGEDQIRNVMRLPYRQRFSIILNELGATLAGRGEDLDKVIRGADPALRELDNVLKILARQNKILAEGARNGDRVLTAWARTRKETADAIVQGATAATATAEVRGDLERNLQKFPAFLRELQPTMVALGRLADETLPVARDIAPVGKQVSQILVALAPFSRAGIPAFQSLGDTADIGSVALPDALNTVEILQNLTNQARGTTKVLAELLSSIDQTNGIRYLTQVIYNLALSVNGYDQFGHWLRTALLAGCNSQATTVNQACSANFVKGVSSSSASASSASNGSRTPLERILNGHSADKVLANYRRHHGGRLPARRGPASVNGQQAPAGGTGSGAAAKGKAPQPARPKPANPDDAVVNYLLGGDG